MKKFLDHFTSLGFSVVIGSCTFRPDYRSVVLKRGEEVHKSSYKIEMLEQYPEIAIELMEDQVRLLKYL